MIAVHLAFRAFDVHELACHFVAQRAGLYAARGLEVHLLDANFVPEEQLPARTFHAACTAALIGALQGAPLRVVFVACERPMFWLVGRAGGAGLRALEGARIAGYPPSSPPAALLRLVRQAHGLAGGGEPLIVAARDDAARLGLLLAGEVEAAVISSALLPARLCARGLAVLEFFGDVLRLPSTGLAVHRALQEREPALVRAMCACYRESLQRLHTDERLSGEALAAFVEFAGAGPGEALELLRRCYTLEGRCAAQVLDAAVESMRRIVGAGAGAGADLYDFTAL